MGASGGNFAIQMAPKVVTATDEDELLPRSEKLRKRMLRSTVTMMTMSRSGWAAVKTSAVTRMTRGGKSLGTRGRALRTRSEGERGSVYCDVQTRVLCNAVLQYCSTVQC